MSRMLSTSLLSTAAAAQCGASMNAGIVLGKNAGEDWDFCSVCKQPLPWGRRNVALEEKSAREGSDRYNEVRQNAVDAQRKKD
jgi:hypothetical protein